MSIDVADVRQEAGSGRDVSGSAVHVVIGMVRAHSGDVGVAQALALAGERRSFTELADPTRWSSLAETVALLNAAALVTGDGAIGLHVGEVLLFTPEGTRLRRSAPGPRLDPEAALQHIEPVIDHFETTSSAGAVEVAPDHALVEVVPKHRQPRHAHLCELTRGLLAQIPALFDLEPALITETECAARGGRRCLYALSWEPHGLRFGRRRRAGAGGHVGPRPSPTPAPPSPAGTDAPARSPRTDGNQGTSDRSAAELQEQLDRMSLLVGGAFATSARAPGRRRRVAADPDRRPRRRRRLGPPVPADGPGPARDADPTPPSGSRRRRRPSNWRPSCGARIPASSTDPISWWTSPRPAATTAG